MLCSPSPALAYVGPGAGFAFVSSLFVLVWTMALGLLTLATLPIRWVVQRVRGVRAGVAGRVRRVVVLGLDGQDPELTERLMDEGVLPHFARLRAEGAFCRLRTTLAGRVAGRLVVVPDRLQPGQAPHLRLPGPQPPDAPPGALLGAGGSPRRGSCGRDRFGCPVGRPRITRGRRSRPFWKTLADHGVPSTILRVPVTFPPEPFDGALLAAMSVPDLRGSQGTYTYFSSDPDERMTLRNGERVPVAWADGVALGVITGPADDRREGGAELRLPFEVRAAANGHVDLHLQGVVHSLRRREYSPWIRLRFGTGPGTAVHGIVRFRLLETDPHLKLYMTPIHIDPDRPALPISHPFSYAVYLSKTQGRYATLGLAEDTSALNEGVIDEAAFLDQAYLIHAERERMFFDALDKTRTGAVVCVFDITDRLQHMFFRHLDSGHPANRGRDAEHRDAIRKLYVEMDALVGTTRGRGGARIRLSSSCRTTGSSRSGAASSSIAGSARRGFLAVRAGKPAGNDLLGDVDWTRTRAYAIGFGGIYLNLAGREARGNRPAGGEAAALKGEIRDRLRALVDEAEGVHPVREVYDAREVYSGPYVDDAPDLIVGFRPGHRVGWTSVTGGIGERVFEDNTRPWSGDHNFNPPDVPGMLFADRPLAAASPSIMDVGPTVLDLLGVPVPSWCDGRSLLPGTEDAQGAGVPASRPAAGAAAP